MIELAKAIALTLVLPGMAWPHGGGLNSEGCHNNRKTGDYHCHRSGGEARKSPNAREDRSFRAGR